MSYYKELGKKLREHHKVIEKKVETLKTEEPGKVPPVKLDTIYEVSSAILEIFNSISNINNTSDMDKPVSTAQQEALNNKVPVTRTINGKPLTEDITISIEDVNADVNDAINAVLTDAKAYTDTKIDEIVGKGASDTLNTIGEISQAFEEHKEVAETLNAAIGNKANKNDLTSHTGNTNIHIDNDERTAWNNKAERDEIIADNLLPYPYNDTSKTINGITFTDNGDGSVTMNGTATADAIFLLSPVYLKAGTYTLSVSDSGFDSNKCNIQLSNSANDIWWGIKNTSNASGVNTYTLTEDLLFNYNRLLVKSGHTMNNVTWKPMLEVGNTAHPWQPYNLSREKLREDIDTNKTKLNSIDEGANNYTHPTYTARNGKPLRNSSPAFGDVITVSQITSDETGHVADLKDRSFVIPNTLSNGTETAGLIKTTSDVTSNSGYTACPVINGVPYYKDTDTNTKNTAGSTDSSKKLFLIGAESQAANPQTYSHDTAYVGADGCVYSGGKKTSVEGHSHDSLSGKKLLAKNAKDTWDAIPYIDDVGVMEVGKYIDFHITDGNTADCDVRIAADTKGLTFGGKTNLTVNQNLKIADDGGVSKTVIQVKNPTPNAPVSSGSEVMFGGGGNVFVGAGESYTALKNAMGNSDTMLEHETTYDVSGERLYLSADSSIKLYSDCNTIENRKAITMSNGHLYPNENEVQNLGSNTNNWRSLYASERYNLFNNEVLQGYMGVFQKGTTSQEGQMRVVLGNSIATGNADNSSGAIILFGKNSGYTYIIPSNDTANNVDIHLPETPGTLALNTVASTSANGLMSKDDKTKLDNTNVAYGTCSTAAATAAKVITISGNTKWTLKAGSTIVVKFTNTNTAQNPTFNVNNTGAKKVWYNTSLITTGSLGYAGTANRPMQFVYDGTQFVFMGWSMDTDSNTDTKNTTGTTNKIDTKLFLAGATSQGANPQTYSNANVYIGTDNCLYSNGKKVVHEVTITTDTDFNTFTETGIYHIAFTGGSNRPSGNYGTLYVDTEVGTDYQLFIPDSVDTVMYKRSYDNNNKVWKAWTTQKLTDTNTTYSNMTAATSNAAGKAGLVPAPAKGAQAKFLRGDGTWQTPTNTTYSNFVKSGSGAKAGLVPAPSTTAGTTKYLREDGTWQVPPDTNTTYTNASLGQGYGTCSTAEATVAKVVTLSNYTLTLGGMVSVKFTYAVPASATMNINSKGAKKIFYRGAAITEGIINAGDIATFIYDGTQYHLISIDKGVLNNTAIGALGFVASTAPNLLPTVSTMAFWNGAYTGNKSNLAYCNKGAFGSIVTKNTDDYLPKTGGTLTGKLTIDLSANTLASGATQDMLTVKYKDEGEQVFTTSPIRVVGSKQSSPYNASLLMGSTNGSTILASGESSSTMPETIKAYDNENIYLIADSNIHMYTGCSNDASSYKKVLTLGTDGNATFLNKVTATEFKGDLTGNADTATRASNSNGIKSSLQSSKVTSNTYFRIAYSSSSSTGEGDTVLKHDGSFQHYFQYGTADTIGASGLSLGNSTKSGTAGNTRGTLRMFDSNDKLGILYAGNGTLTANRNYYLPDQSGTLVVSGKKSTKSGNTCSITLTKGRNYIVTAHTNGSIAQCIVSYSGSDTHPFHVVQKGNIGSSNNAGSVSGNTLTMTVQGGNTGVTLYWLEF